MSERTAEISIRTDTVVQIGCMGCEKACTFGMDGLEGMRTVADMQMLGTDVPYTVTEMAGILVDGKTTGGKPALTREYFNGGRTPNDTGTCGDPCTRRPDIVKTALAAERATNERGITTEHMSPL